MNIVIKSHDGDKIADGEYLYVEGGLAEGVPSFHITLRDSQRGYFDIYFSLKDIEELEDLLGNIHKSVRT